ncbi:hypothetical protein [Chryseobacterium foetidum]|uniref:hypothetical protein n=1 Tax=Chryseobacterium foetidum TaxID=2951057 RepID=UPI0021C98012|nr:hypothetical protein [Chryseobacterium foetidum]
MTKKILFTACLFLSLLNFSQTKISTKKTDKHLLIEGTSVHLLPPNGYEKAANFIGFQNSYIDGSIIVNELPAPYKELRDGFSKENMSKKGMEFVDKQEYFINNKPALLIDAKQYSTQHNYYFSKIILIYKLDENKTLLINANVPENQAENLMNLKSSVLTLIYDESIKVSPFSSLDFDIDYSKSAYKLTKSISGTLTFEGPEKEVFIVAKSIRQFNPADKKGSSINALKAISQLDYISLISSKDINQDGMSGYQISANVLIKNNKKPMKAIQAILFSDNCYYTFLTVVKPQEKNLINDFEKILSTFKRK